MSFGSAAASGVSALRVIGDERRSTAARGGEAAPGGPCRLSHAFKSPQGLVPSAKRRFLEAGGLMNPAWLCRKQALV